MFKIIWRIILIILPILLLIGFARMLVHGFSSDVNFLPTPIEFLNIWNTAPDFLSSIRQSISDVGVAFSNADFDFSLTSNAYDEMIDAWSNVYELISFFVALGKTFQMIGLAIVDFFINIGKFFGAFSSIFVLIWNVVKTPFEVLYWFFTQILGFSFVTTQ